MHNSRHPVPPPRVAKLQSQVQRLALNALALAAGGIVAQLAFTLIEVLAARKLGVEAYGVFVTAYAWTGLGVILMELGTPLWTVQEGSRRHGRLPELLGSALAINLVTFLVLYAALAVAVGVFPGNPVLSFLLILLPYGLILTAHAELAAVYASYQTMHVTSLFQGLAPVVILMVYAIYSAGELTLNEVGLAYVIGGTLVTVAWFAYTFRRLRPRVSVQSVRETLRSSYQYALSGILGQVYYKADVVMLSALAGLREAGIYAAAFKLVELVYKVAVLLARVFAPALFKASDESDSTFRVFASLMTRFLAFAGLLAGVVTFVLAEELIMLMFGESYSDSVPILQIFGGVMAAKCMLISSQLLLSTIDLHFQRVANLAITVVVHIGLNAALIPKFGALGAAWATMFSGVLVIVLNAWSASRRSSFSFLKWLLLPSCIAVSVSVAMALTNVDPWFQAAVAVAAFLAGLYLIGFVHRDEVRLVFRSLGGWQK
jgi:O-antigen/teichoic acid export membrane protein